MHYHPLLCGNHGTDSLAELNTGPAKVGWASSTGHRDSVMVVVGGGGPAE